MFFVVRSNHSFNFPLGLIQYIVIVTGSFIISHSCTGACIISLSCTGSVIISHSCTGSFIILILTNGTDASDISVCSLTCFDDVLFHLKTKPRLRTIPASSISVLLNAEKLMQNAKFTVLISVLKRERERVGGVVKIFLL